MHFLFFKIFLTIQQDGRKVEATLTSPRTNLELQLNCGEITQNKWLNNIESEAL